VHRKRIEELARNRVSQISDHTEEKEQPAISTGGQALSIVLADEDQTPKAKKPQIVLYLKEKDLKEPESNWTEYPNEIHQLMAESLTEYESILYVKLWRESRGYGRNYCRIGYKAILKETTIKSLSTARRAMSGLRDKHFVILALNEENKPDVTNSGTLYRVCTPSELMSGKVEEGISLSHIPVEGALCTLGVNYEVQTE